MECDGSYIGRGAFLGRRSGTGRSRGVLRRENAGMSSAVSYTHLDVYKRQLHTHFGFHTDIEFISKSKMRNIIKSTKEIKPTAT